MLKGSLPRRALADGLTSKKPIGGSLSECRDGEMRAFTEAERQCLIHMYDHRAGARGLARDDVFAIGFALNRSPSEVASEIVRLRTLGLLPLPAVRRFVKQ
jgi:hypothetical protein